MWTFVSKCYFNQFHNFSFKNAKVKKINSSFTNLNIKIMSISSNFNTHLTFELANHYFLLQSTICSLNWYQKVLATALGACIFIMNLNMDICKSKMLAFKGSKISN